MTISVKFFTEVNGCLGYKMAQKNCERFQPAEQGARTFIDKHTNDDRRTGDDKYYPNVTQRRSGTKNEHDHNEESYIKKYCLYQLLVRTHLIYY